MKNIKQITKKLFLALISAVIVLTSQNVNAVASSIELGVGEVLPGYVSGVKFNTKVKKDGTLLYCLNMNKKTAKNITAKLVGERDAGVAYIMLNGYPHKKFTGERLKDYYITQSALWWYLDNTTGSSNLSNKFKTTGSDEYNLRPIIKKLVAEAEAARKKGYAKTTLTISANNYSMTLKDDYFVSEEISAKTYSNILTYRVTANGAPGIQIVDAAGKSKSTFKVIEKFRVKVPASSVTGTELSINVVANATGITYKAYEYQPVNAGMQPVTPAIPEKEEEQVSSKVTLTIDSSIVKILKVDSETGNALAGAKFILKDSTGNIEYPWESTTTYHSIRNLPNGTYTITEISAPEGYILNSKPIAFTISDSKRSFEYKIENTPRESVVNILKIDASTGKPLAGAVLVLKDSTGEEIYRINTTTEPEVITGLENGTYTVEEVSAPAGYMHSSKIETFTISDQNLSHQVIFENYPEVPVPDTDSSSLIITLLGIVIIGLGIRFVYKNGKKSR